MKNDMVLQVSCEQFSKFSKEEDGGGINAKMLTKRSVINCQEKLGCKG